jgi:hypothetical protein
MFSEIRGRIAGQRTRQWPLRQSQNLAPWWAQGLGQVGLDATEPRAGASATSHFAATRGESAGEKQQVG